MAKFETRLDSSETTKQLLRYACVGVMSNAAGYLIYLLLTSLEMAPKLAMSMLYGVSAMIGFFGNRNLTFSHKGARLGSSVRYIFVHVVGYLINLAVLVIFVDQLGWAHQFVQASAILIVATFLFITFKLFVFKSSSDN